MNSATDSLSDLPRRRNGSVSTRSFARLESSGVRAIRNGESGTRTMRPSR